jgi:transcriptional regulator with XRE-family HTH domain
MARKSKDDLLAALPPEARARAEAALASARTSEARAHEEQVRAHYADRPSIQELVGRGEVDVARIVPQRTVHALHRAFAQARRAREAAGMSLAELSRRSGLAVAKLSRLESGKSGGFTFETLARYAAAIGFDTEIVLTPRTTNGGASSQAELAERAHLLNVVRTKLAELLELTETMPAGKTD